MMTLRECFWHFTILWNHLLSLKSPDKLQVRSNQPPPPLPPYGGTGITCCTRTRATMGNNFCWILLYDLINPFQDTVGIIEFLRHKCYTQIFCKNNFTRMRLFMYSPAYGMQIVILQFHFSNARFLWWEMVENVPLEWSLSRWLTSENAADYYCDQENLTLSFSPPPSWIRW